jgi:hypothetical protein
VTINQDRRLSPRSRPARSRTTRALAVGIAILALAGCSGGVAPAGGPGPSGPPATTRSTSAAPQHDGPPQGPSLAREHSNAGAKAFVRYYIDVLNYAWTNGNPRALREFDRRGCSLCSDFVTVLERRTRRGGRQVGGTFAVDRVGVAGVGGDGEYLLVADITVSRGQSWATATSQPTRIHHDSHSLNIHLRWRKSSWTLQNLEVG